MIPALRLHLPLSYGTNRREGFVDLVVKLLPVGDDEEGVIPLELPQNLLGEKDHRKRLPAPLSMPIDSKLPLVFLTMLQSIEGVVDPEVLMVLGHQLDQPHLLLREKGKVFHDVQEAVFLAGAPDHRLQGDPALLALAVYLLPFCEMLPGSSHAAHLALRTV